MLVLAIVADGRTYAYPEAMTSDEARALWMEPAPGRTVVAVLEGSDGGEVVAGTAKMGPNRPGRGAHVATASVMVDPAHRGRGVGRALGQELVRWSRGEGYDGIQFNAVVATNTTALALWCSLGFEVVGTVPGAFDDRVAGLVDLHVLYLKLR